MDEADRHRLSPDQHARIFLDDIVPDLTAAIRSVDRPHAVILGGQPGAGKSALQSAVELELAAQGGVLAIVGDDLRAYHPKYRALLRADDKLAAYYTDRDSALWIEKLIEFATQHRFNVLIESTMRRPDKIVATATALRASGYHVEARALAVHERWSTLGIHQRYEAMLKSHGRARFTLQQAHDAAYAGMLQTLDELEGGHRVDRIAIYARGNSVLHDNVAGPTGWTRAPAARATVEAERARPWSAVESCDYLQAWMRIVSLRRARRAAREDVAFARLELNRALVETYTNAAARTELEKRLSRAQGRTVERAAAVAAFELSPPAAAVRAFPALAPYFAERDRLTQTAPNPRDIERLIDELTRTFPDPPARQRSRGRGR